MDEVILLRKEYSRLESYRDPFLQRGRDCAKLTIPALLPPAGATGSTKLKTTFSSFGARLVNNLSAKLALSLFPPGSPFFKLVISDSALRKMVDPAMRSEVEKGLASVESEVMDQVETSSTRNPATEAIKHLIVCGNVLVYLDPTGGLRVFPLGTYVVKRDAQGKVMTIILKEDVSPMSLPARIRQVAIEKSKAERLDNSPEKTLALYTGIYLKDNHWDVWQEVANITVPGSRNQQPVDANPWMPLRWTHVDGEDYGRGMVEDYLGDLISVEGLTASVVKGTAAAVRLIYLRRPNGTVRATAFSKATTGDVIDGVEGDITVPKSDKQADLRTAREVINDLKEQLSFAFALNQAIQRNAERVTAEEIRYMANELDSLLGGIYSSLSLEFQAPYLRRLMRQMERSGRLPPLPKGTVKPVIVTGVAALGRGAELENLKAFVKDIVDLGGPEALNSEVDFSDLVKRLAVARNIKPDGLILSPDARAAKQAQAQQQQMVQNLGPNAVNAAGGIAKQALANGQQIEMPQ